MACLVLSFVLSLHTLCTCSCSSPLIQVVTNGSGRWIVSQFMRFKNKRDGIYHQGSYLLPDIFKTSSSVTFVTQDNFCAPLGPWGVVRAEPDALGEMSL